MRGHPRAAEVTAVLIDLVGEGGGEVAAPASGAGTFTPLCVAAARGFGRVVRLHSGFLQSSRASGVCFRAKAFC